MAAASAFTGTGGATMSGSVVVLVARPRSTRLMCSSSSLPPPARCAVVGTATPAAETASGGGAPRRSGQLAVPPGLVDELVEEALVWCSQHGLVVGDKNHPVSDVPCYLAIPTYFTSHVHASRSS